VGERQALIFRLLADGDLEQLQQEWLQGEEALPGAPLTTLAESVAAAIATAIHAGADTGPSFSSLVEGYLLALRLCERLRELEGQQPEQYFQREEWLEYSEWYARRARE
jgi:hypothetical protein